MIRKLMGNDLNEATRNSMAVVDIGKTGEAKINHEDQHKNYIEM